MKDKTIKKIRKLLNKAGKQACFLAVAFGCITLFCLWLLFQKHLRDKK